MPRSPFETMTRRSRAWRKQGDRARDARDWPAAAAAYREHLALEPEAAPIWVQLGHMLKEAGDFDAALAAYDRAAALAPDSADAHLHHGQMLARLGRVAEAEQALRASVAIDGNGDARRELAALEERAREAEPEPAEPETSESVPAPPAPRDLPAAKARPAPAPPPRHVGAIDGVSGVSVSGWVVDPGNPAMPAVVEFYSDAGMIGRAAGDLFRSDVAQSDIGTTHPGFEATLALDRDDRRVVTVRAFLQGTGEELANSPFETSGFSIVRQPAGNPVTAARIAFAKRVALPPSREVALFVSHAPDGVLKPHVPPYLEALRDNGVSVLLIVVADRPVRLASAQLALVDGAIVRENVGDDFAAWGHALRLHPELYGCDILYLVGDGMVGPNGPAAFAAMMARLRASAADLVGLTESHDGGWHVQSSFVALKRPLLASAAVQAFFGDIVNVDDAGAARERHEVKLAPLAEAHGFTAEALFASHDPRDPTMFAWRELIGSGFPFVDVRLLRSPSDIAKREHDLARFGFDPGLLRAMARPSRAIGRAAPGFPLLAMPEDDDRAAGAPLKVAFYGPWNYDNGLGAASRNIVAAIRRTGVRLNLHPVKRPFHVHRPLGPANDIRDFEGAADIAVVHLNPDSWHLLTDDQRADIRLARKRIGYWVWEMLHLPPAWRAEFGTADRIWAPSRYCAELFDAQHEAPVDVVPHPVPLPVAGGDAGERAAVLAALGLAADARIILYVFDGSSYLIRKNPHALVRAFAAAKLGARGWTLVLKTKHLMDRPEDGAAFRALAEATPGVLLVDRPIPLAELHALVAAADIYASPHCSEGFGLTVAEAMAAGKPVVATDYSGPTDFLDAATGYPVPAETYRLDDDFGHYTKGGEWARIDEAALAEALVRAADDVAAGDRALADAARARIADYLSYDAVAERIAASFDAVLAEDARPRWPRPRPLDSRMERGVPADRVDLGASLAIAPLAPGSLAPVGDDDRARVANASDRWLVFAPADALFDPHLRTVFRAHAEGRPDVAIFYGDDFAAGDGPELGDQLRLKPEFDITLFTAQDYIGAPLIVRGSALHALGGLRHDLGAAALTDLVLRAWTAGMGIVRIPYVLIGHPGRRPTVAVEERRAVLAGHPAFAGCDLLPGLAPGTLRLARRFADAPAVTLLVPTRQSASADGRLYVERLLDSIARTDWPMDRLHVLIGDDVAGPAAWTATPRPFALRRIETPRPPGAPFNYAAKMNLLWRAAATEHVVMLNDDVVANDPDWLKALMTFAVDGDVGAVGPLLLYDDGTVQHAGIVGGLLGIVAHAWLYRRSTARTYQDWALTHREWSMITGAVVATRRSMLERVDGFDERLALEYNDLDLCLRLRASGARIVYTPHARMTHSEKASRGAARVPPEELALFLRRWQGWLTDDPAFHPRMDHHRFDLEPGYDPDDWFVR